MAPPWMRRLFCSKPQEAKKGRTIDQVKNPEDGGKPCFRMEVENLTQEKLLITGDAKMVSGKIVSAATNIDVSYA